MRWIYVHEPRAVGSGARSGGLYPLCIRSKKGWGACQTAVLQANKTGRKGEAAGGRDCGMER